MERNKELPHICTEFDRNQSAKVTEQHWETERFEASRETAAMAAPRTGYHKKKCFEENYIFIIYCWFELDQFRSYKMVINKARKNMAKGKQLAKWKLMWEPSALDLLLQKRLKDKKPNLEFCYK